MEVIGSNEKLTVDEALETMINVYTSEGYRERTISDFQKFYTEFFRIIEGPQYIEAVTTNDFRNYINVLLRKRGLSPVTVNVRMNALRSLWN